MILFPGCSVSDILSSAVGQAVRAQLMETIQAYDSSSDQQRSATQKPYTCFTDCVIDNTW